MDDEFITVKELSEIIKLTSKTILRWRKEGMPSEHMERGVRFKKNEVLQWIKENKGQK